MDIYELARLGNTRVFISKVEQNPDTIHKQDEHGKTVFMYACECGHMDMVRYLTEKLSKVPHSAFHTAVVYGRLDIVRYLLSKGASPSSCDDRNETPAYKASRGNHVDILKELIAHNGTLRQINTSYESALTIAIIHEHIDILKVLIQTNISFTCSYHKDSNALWTALLTENMDIITLLLESGKVDFAKKLPVIKDVLLYRARNSYKLVAILLKFGFDPNLYVHGCNPPLVMACKEYGLDMVKLLLLHGAKPNIRGYEQTTPLLWSVFNKDMDMTRLLIQHHAEVNTGNLHGTTIIDVACSSGLLSSVELLVSVGATLTTQTMFSALKSKNVNIMRFLIQRITMDKSPSTLSSLRFNSTMFSSQSMGKFVQKVCNLCHCSTLAEAIPHLETANAEEDSILMDRQTWHAILSYPLQVKWHVFLADAHCTAVACYLAVYEENETMVRFRQGKMVSFSESRLRQLMRPYGARPMRKRIVSYLVYPHSQRVLYGL